MSDRERPEAAETLAFRAEVDALLRLVTHSLYTNREIFLRELVSNASDALDRARFQGLVDDQLRDRELAPVIVISVDRERGVLAIDDSGIGMTRQEVVDNLGTIASSGTLRFLERLRDERGDRPDLNLIGQFGVGFYSALMVADRVEVHTRSALPGHDAVRWSTRGEGTFVVEPGDRPLRGTRVELQLKDDAKEFLERVRIETLVRRYSNYVMHPIRFAEGTAAPDDKQLNDGTAIWAKSARELGDDDYREFYRHVAGGFVLPGDEPLARLHVNLDAPIQFSALLFVPARAPADLFMDDRKAIGLYVQRVLVIEDCDKLLPPYLRFFRGVVDSQDLPLNVSRELLQEHKTLAAIRRQLVRRCVKLLEEVAKEDPDRYRRIWTEFGSVLKEGLHTDNAHREELTRLLRYRTSASGEGLVALDEYVAAMPADQDAIWYSTGESAVALAGSPHLEAFRARGWAVLLMTDPVDEWVVQDLHEYAGKPLRNVAQGELPVAEADESTRTALEPLLGPARTILGERVKDVRASTRLTRSASCLVDDEGGLGRNMERLLRLSHRQVPSRPRILELNPTHPYVKALARIAAERPDDQRIGARLELLLDLAHLADGEVPDPVATVQRLQAVLDRSVERAD